MATYDFSAPRLCVDTALANGAFVPLDKGQQNYLCNVLRLSEGNAVLIFNGRDGEWRAVLSDLGRKKFELKCEAQIRPQTLPGDLHYVFAPLKHARLDYMAQKAVEMGASLLQPVTTRRTQVGRVNIDRMRANVIEATEQCGIISIAKVCDLRSLNEVLADWADDRILIFATRPPTRPMAPRHWRL